MTISVPKIKGAFEAIGVLGRVDNSQAVSTLNQLSDFLLAQDKKLCFDSATGQAITGTHDNIEIMEIEHLCKHVDLLIVVGGDGTLLTSARTAAQFGVPLLGVNQGRLGFLTDIKPKVLEVTLSRILEGEYLVDERFLLEAQVGNSFTGTALNDIVLNSGTAVTMVEYELYVDDTFVYSQAADGLIISTPTGSTAYALSGGGPIMHPELDALVLVPICPHTLSSRPMVIDGNSEVRIVTGSSKKYSPQIACDGQQTRKIAAGEELRVKKSKYSLLLLHPQHHEFYEACRSKLGWGTKLF